MTRLALLLALYAASVACVWRTSIQPAWSSHVTRSAHVAFVAADCATMLASAREAFAVSTPYLDDQVVILARDLSLLADLGKLDACPDWREIVAHESEVVAALLSAHPGASRQRWVYARALHVVGVAGREPALVQEAGRQYERLEAGSPHRQLLRLDRGRWLVDAGRLDEARAEYDAALALAPEVGEVMWQVGVFRWASLRDDRGGAALMVAAMGGACPYHTRSAGEAAQLAQARALP